MLWNTPQIKQCKHQLGQLLLSDEQELFFVNQDFGHMTKGSAVAVCSFEEIEHLQNFLQFATQHQLPLTIRANGLSQSGQSLAIKGGVSLDISSLNSQVSFEPEGLKAGCSATWKTIIKQTLKEKKLPRVFPYNTNLTLGGVLSVGGVGSSSFREGILAAHVHKLDVVVANGELISCSNDKFPDLFNACLSGAGLFGIISNAVLELRNCRNNVQIVTLLYDNYQSWIQDQFVLKEHGDYLEAYISPESIHDQQKACIIQLGMEYDEVFPPMTFLNELRFAKKLATESKTIWEYVTRHDGRLTTMRNTGAWEAHHPWYECYVDSRLLLPHVQKIVNLLDNSIGGIYHIFPIANRHPKYFMLPESNHDVTFNVLAPGISADKLEVALEALKEIDEVLLNLGGKRYISGWIPQQCNENFWKSHYGHFWEERNQIKLDYDPANIFCSQLFPYRRESSC
jgi:hypothetical protein